MTQKQKESAETALIAFIERVAKSGTDAEVQALPGTVHALINLSNASDVSSQQKPKEKLRGITIHLSVSEPTRGIRTEATANK